MVELNIIQKIAVWLVPVLLAITVHEVAHGYVARRFGDTTAYMMGRLTLNPFKHIDPIGTVLVPAIMLLLPGSFIFGWARPVPVNFSQLRNPKTDMALVAAAGPGVNLLMAVGWAILARIGAELVRGNAVAFQPLVLMGVAGIYINILLMVLNLLPLPPLDGGRVVAGLLPDKASWQFSRIEPYGVWILIGLLITGLLGFILFPFLDLILKLVVPISDISVPGFWRILQLLTN